MKKSKIIIAAILFLTGIFFKFVLVGYSFLGYCFMVSALAVVYFEFLKESKEIKYLKLFYNFSLTILLIFLFFFALTEVFVIKESFGQPSESADVVIVLGAGVNGTKPSYSLKTRLAAAKELLERNKDIICIASGGQGSGEDISEALCMYNYLTENGISGDRIILEDKSSTTEENISFSLDIIRENNLSSGKIAVVSSEYHLLRAKLIFSSHGYDVSGVPAKTTYPVLKLNYLLREVPAVWKFLLFG